jgi:hypothetical protein
VGALAGFDGVDRSVVDVAQRPFVPVDRLASGAGVGVRADDLVGRRRP